MVIDDDHRGRGQSTVITDDVCVVVLPLLENELRVISVSVGK